MFKSYRGFIEWFSHAEWWEATLDAKDYRGDSSYTLRSLAQAFRGTLKASDIAKTMVKERTKSKTIPRHQEEVKKTYVDQEKSVKKPSRIVVVGPEKGSDLTVIDGVHRVIRLCMYYFVKKKGGQPRYFAESVPGPNA